jgi:asparagine synthase (glutamine-hydrolysing)
MCGIAGFIDRFNGEQQNTLISKMLESIGHRGPDFRGVWTSGEVALGHNRLAIVDLTVDGNQPMEKFDLQIVYNGEVYNFVELRDELRKHGYDFKSSSDTEVILTAYYHWGESCVERFEGMWAFAIWDSKKKTLFCSRDRFGIKPFYYIFKNGAFYFASEYKALKFSPLFKNDLNIDQVSRSLQLGWCTFHNETYFKDINQLEAGHNLKYTDRRINIERYWQIQPGRYKYIDHETAKNDFRLLLEDAVKKHMRSDVEIAVCLSGGIDSSSLTGLIVHLFPDLKFQTYSIYYDGQGEVDERPFINEVTARSSNIIPLLYKPDKNVIPDFFNDVVEKSDVPITGSSPISHYYLVKKIRENGIKVVLDGQGADEYLAGYIPAYYRWIGSDLQSMHFNKAFQKLKQVQREKELTIGGLAAYFGKSLLSALNAEKSLMNVEYKRYYPFLVKQGLLSNSRIDFESVKYNRLDDYLFHAITDSSLPTILHYVDRMTMSFSVESRVPLLDHRLVDFAFSLPSTEKIRNGVTKAILRESVKDLLPEKVYHRKDKKGFVTPGEDVWLRGQLKWLLNIDYKNLDFIDSSIAKKVVQSYLNGDNSNARLVWRLGLLNYWLKKNG